MKNNNKIQFSWDGKPFGGRKFILVQLPEKISEKKEAYKAGYSYYRDKLLNFEL